MNYLEAKNMRFRREMNSIFYVESECVNLTQDKVNDLFMLERLMTLIDRMFFSIIANNIDICFN